MATFKNKKVSPRNVDTFCEKNVLRNKENPKNISQDFYLRALKLEMEQISDDKNKTENQIQIPYVVSLFATEKTERRCNKEKTNLNPTQACEKICIENNKKLKEAYGKTLSVNYQKSLEEENERYKILVEILSLNV